MNEKFNSGEKTLSLSEIIYFVGCGYVTGHVNSLY